MTNLIIHPYSKMCHDYYMGRVAFNRMPNADVGQVAFNRMSEWAVWPSIECLTQKCARWRSIECRNGPCGLRSNALRGSKQIKTLKMHRWSTTHSHANGK